MGLYQLFLAKSALNPKLANCLQSTSPVPCHVWILDHFHSFSFIFIHFRFPYLCQLIGEIASNLHPIQTSGPGRRDGRRRPAALPPLRAPSDPPGNGPPESIIRKAYCICGEYCRSMGKKKCILTE